MQACVKSAYTLKRKTCAHMCFSVCVCLRMDLRVSVQAYAAVWASVRAYVCVCTRYVCVQVLGRLPHAVPWGAVYVQEVNKNEVRMQQLTKATTTQDGDDRAAAQQAVQQALLLQQRQQVKNTILQQMQDKLKDAMGRLSNWRQQVR